MIFELKWTELEYNLSTFNYCNWFQCRLVTSFIVHIWSLLGSNSRISLFIPFWALPTHERSGSTLESMDMFRFVCFCCWNLTWWICFSKHVRLLLEHGQPMLCKFLWFLIEVFFFELTFRINTDIILSHLLMRLFFPPCWCTVRLLKVFSLEK